MNSKEEKILAVEWFKKELNETNGKLNKEEFENRQLKELIVSMKQPLKEEVYKHVVKKV